MKRDRLLDVAAVGMGIALVLMLVALAWPTPATLGFFLGMGWPMSLLAVVLFAIRVLRMMRML